MILYNEKIKPILDDLENPNIELAGGSTVGMLLSITNSLIIYICNLTIGKKKYMDVEEEVRAIKQNAQMLKEKSLNAIDKDRIVLNNILKAYKVQKEEPQKLEDASKESVLFCESVMEDCFEDIKLINKLEKVGNKLLVSDFEICKKYAFTALEASIVNIDINLKYITDKEFINQIESNYKKIQKEAQKF